MRNWDIMNISFENRFKDLELRSLQKNGKLRLSFENTRKSYLLSDILPYDVTFPSKSSVEKRLKEYFFLLEACKQASEAARSGDYTSFDPLVGENGCQIRAMMNIFIFSNNLFNYKKLSIRTSEIMKAIKIIRKENYDFIRVSQTLKELLETQDLEIKITKAELFLIRSFILTGAKEYKEVNVEIPFVKNSRTNTKKIMEIAPVGRIFAQKIIKSLRINISSVSCEYVQELESLFRLPKEISENVSSEHLVQYKGLSCLPCYWYTLVLLLQAIYEETPIVMIAKKLKRKKGIELAKEMVFCYRIRNGKYEVVSKEELDIKKPALFLVASSLNVSNEGFSMTEWKSSLLNYSPIDLVLAFAAVHRQYPDDSKSYLIDDHQDICYQYYKKMAKEKGCTIKNPSLFFLSHAFCDKIENISKHLEKTEAGKGNSSFELGSSS